MLAVALVVDALALAEALPVVFVVTTQMCVADTDGHRSCRSSV